jgi:hypothetical protein
MFVMKNKSADSDMNALLGTAFKTEKSFSNSTGRSVLGITNISRYPLSWAYRPIYMLHLLPRRGDDHPQRLQHSIPQHYQVPLIPVTPGSDPTKGSCKIPKHKWGRAYQLRKQLSLNQKRRFSTSLKERNIM